MANQRLAAVEDKVRNAENIIQSYAYGDDLDQAIEDLKELDPDNSVLASIKDFDNNREMLKALNALYRADVARAGNDMAELQKVAEFLETSSYEAENMHKEAVDIWSELSALEEDEPENAETIGDMLDEVARLQHAYEKHDYVQSHTPSMEDEEIVDNAKKISSIFDSFKWSDVIGSDDNVTIVDDNGNPLNAEEEANLKGAQRKWIELATISDHMDDAAFAAMDDDEQKEVLKENVRERYEGDIIQKALATAEMDGASGDEKENIRRMAMSRRPIKIRVSAFHASFDSTRERISDKISKFFREGKDKSKRWLSQKFEKLNAFTRKHTGYTPVEFGKMVITAMSKRRFAANIGVSMGSLGASGGAMAMLAAGSLAATPAIAIAATGIAAYTAYNALAQQRWTIWEKKHAYWKAAKESGDEAEIAKWSGMAGWNNARNAIRANPEENEIYETIKKNNKRYSLISGGLMGVATAFVPLSSPLLRGLGGLGRGVAANTNAKFMYDLAKEKYEANPTEINEINMKRARTGLYFGIAGTAAVELAVAWSVANSGVGAEHNPQNVASHEHAPTVEKTAPAPAPVAEIPEVKVEVPQEWNSDMGITQNQWNTLHSVGDFDSKWLNVHNAQQANPDAFVHTDGSQMSIEEAVWKSDRIMSLAKAYPDGEGGYIAHMYDENHVEVFAKDGGWVYKDGTPVTSKDIAPECWGTEEDVAYKSVDCGEKASGVDGETFDNLYDRAIHGNGDNYMDVDNCGKVHFIGFVKNIINKIIPHEETVVDTPDPVEPIYEGPTEEQLPPAVDGKVEQHTIIQSVGRVSPGTTGNGSLQLDSSYMKSSTAGAQFVVEDSAVDAGSEVKSDAVNPAAESTLDAGKTVTNNGDTTTNNGEQAFNWMQRTRGGYGIG